MRETVEELLRKEPIWNSEKYNIQLVKYGDIPLIHYDESEYIKFLTYEGSLSNICAVEAYIYTQNGIYDEYRLNIGNIKIALDGTVLCGNLDLKYKGYVYTVILNEMYGFHSLDVLKLGGFKVKGFSNANGQGSPSNRSKTEELDSEYVEAILNLPLEDYGESVHKFMKACRDLYLKDTKNYIMEKTFNL